VTHSEKKKIIEKLVVVPDKQKRNFWGREIKSLNVLLEKYPGYFAKELNKKYKRYKYKIPQQKKIELGGISGDDYKKTVKPKNLREFLS